MRVPGVALVGQMVFSFQFSVFSFEVQLQVTSQLVSSIDACQRKSMRRRFPLEAEN